MSSYRDSTDLGWSGLASRTSSSLKTVSPMCMKNVFLRISSLWLAIYSTVSSSFILSNKVPKVFLTHFYFSLTLSSTIDLPHLESGHICLFPDIFFLASVIAQFITFVYLHKRIISLLCNALLYGDDLQICSADNVLVQSGIGVIIRWTADWHMPINDSKTVHMQFGFNKHR